MAYEKKIIGKSIKAARIAKGLTQKELADKIGVKYQNFYGWENGKHVPTTKYLSMIAKYTDVTIEQLMKGRLSEKNQKIDIVTGVLDNQQKSLISEIVEGSLANDPRIRLIDKQLEELINYIRSLSKDIVELKEGILNLSKSFDNVYKSKPKK